MDDVWQESGTSDRAEHFFPGGAALSKARVWHTARGAWAWELFETRYVQGHEEPSKLLAQHAAIQAWQAARALQAAGVEAERKEDEKTRVRLIEEEVVEQREALQNFRGLARAGVKDNTKKALRDVCLQVMARIDELYPHLAS